MYYLIIILLVLVWDVHCCLCCPKFHVLVEVFYTLFLLLLDTALPYFYEGGQVIANATSTSVTITWNAWNKNIDYGTGPVDKYNVYYWKADAKTSSAISQTVTEAYTKITDLSPETLYYFAVAAVRNYELREGPWSTNTFAATGCGGKSLNI